MYFNVAMCLSVREAILMKRLFAVAVCGTIEQKQLVMQNLRHFVMSMNLVSLAGSPPKPAELLEYEKRGKTPTLATSTTHVPPQGVAIPPNPVVLSPTPPVVGTSPGTLLGAPTAAARISEGALPPLAKAAGAGPALAAFGSALL